MTSTVESRLVPSIMPASGVDGLGMMSDSVLAVNVEQRPATPTHTFVPFEQP